MLQHSVYQGAFGKSLFQGVYGRSRGPSSTPGLSQRLIHQAAFLKFFFFLLLSWPLLSHRSNSCSPNTPPTLTKCLSKHLDHWDFLLSPNSVTSLPCCLSLLDSVVFYIMLLASY